MRHEKEKGEKDMRSLGEKHGRVAISIHRQLSKSPVEERP